jgi:hypothetical protein
MSSKDFGSKDCPTIRTLDQPLGKKEAALFSDKPVRTSPTSKLLEAIQKALKRSYRNNEGSTVRDHRATIEYLQPLLDEFRFYDTKNLGTRQLSMVAEAFNDLGVSLAEKARREKIEPLQFQARTYYLEALRLWPTALTARNFGRLLENMREWKELEELGKWALEKFPGSDMENELRRMRSKARRRK